MTETVGNIAIKEFEILSGTDVVAMAPELVEAALMMDQARPYFGYQFPEVRMALSGVHSAAAYLQSRTHEFDGVLQLDGLAVGTVFLATDPKDGVALVNFWHRPIAGLHDTYEIAYTASTRLMQEARARRHKAVKTYLPGSEPNEVRARSRGLKAAGFETAHTIPFAGAPRHMHWTVLMRQLATP